MLFGFEDNSTQSNSLIFFRLPFLISFLALDLWATCRYDWSAEILSNLIRYLSSFVLRLVSEVSMSLDILAI